MLYKSEEVVLLGIPGLLAGSTFLPHSQASACTAIGELPPNGTNCDDAINRPAEEKPDARLVHLDSN